MSEVMNVGVMNVGQSFIIINGDHLHCILPGANAVDPLGEWPLVDVAQLESVAENIKKFTSISVDHVLRNTVRIEVTRIFVTEEYQELCILVV